MKLLKNIWWLLTKAPVGITDGGDEVWSCDYCGESDGSITNYTTADFKVCQRCLKKALDKSLKES